MAKRNMKLPNNFGNINKLSGNRRNPYRARIRLDYTDEGKQYDEERTAFLKEYGLTVIRIPNTEVHKNFRGVCEYIDRLVEQSLSQLR